MSLPPGEPRAWPTVPTLPALPALPAPRAAAALQYGIERDFTNKTETVVLYDLGAASLQAALVTYSAYTNAKVGGPGAAVVLVCRCMGGSLAVAACSSCSSSKVRCGGQPWPLFREAWPALQELLSPVARTLARQ